MAAPLAFVRRIASQSSTASGTTLILTLGTSLTALPQDIGNALVLYFAWSSTTVGITSVVDSRSNTWTVEPIVTGTAQRGTIATCLAPLRLLAGDTVTITFDSAVTNKAAALDEFSGLKATGTPRDGNTTNSGAGTATTSQAVTGTALGPTTVADDILFAAVFTNQSSASDALAATGWTIDAAVHAGTGISLYPAYKILSATATTTFSGTVSGGGSLTRAWGVGVYAFKISDTRAPRVSSVQVAADIQGSRRAITSVLAEGDVQGAGRAVSSIIVEVDAGYSRAAVASIMAEVDVIVTPATTGRRPGIIVA